MLSDGTNCEGDKDQLGVTTIQMAMGTIWDSTEAWSHRAGVLGNDPGKGGGCVRAGLKPDGRLLQQALGQ